MFGVGGMDEGMHQMMFVVGQFALPFDRVSLRDLDFAPREVRAGL